MTVQCVLDKPARLVCHTHNMLRVRLASAANSKIAIRKKFSLSKILRYTVGR